MALHMVFHLEKRSDQCELSSPSTVLVTNAVICGRTSVSEPGCMSSKVSGCEQVSLAKKAGPFNQMVFFNMAAVPHSLQGCFLWSQNATNQYLWTSRYEGLCL